MGASLISKIKPSYFNKSRIDDDILVIKKLNCLSLKKNLLPLNLKSIEDKLYNLFKHTKNCNLSKELFSKIKFNSGLSILIVSFNGLKDLEDILGSNIDSLDIVVVDKSLNKLKKISKLFKDKLEISLVECCVQELPFLDEMFDIIINIGSFNNYKDKNRAIKEMLRVSKKDGTILISDKIDNKFNSNSVLFYDINSIKKGVLYNRYYYYILTK